jgi:protein SCO1
MPSAAGGREIAPRPLSPVRVLAMFSKVRLRRVAIILASVFVIAAAAVAVNRASQVNAARQLPQIGGHFALSTPDGRRVTDATFHGKWLLVYFGYTSCPDVCPTTLSAMALALDKLGPLADKVQPVFITVDPERDTSKIVGEYVKDFDPRFVGLVGSPQEIGAAAQEFHVYYRVRQLGNNEYVVDHSSFIYLLDPNGAFVRLLTGDLPGHQLADELRKLMS